MKPIVVAVTGTIGSGKSAAARLLAKSGAAIIDADLLAREAVAPGSNALAEIVAHFGQGFLQADGTLNRKELASLVFADEQARAKLESIVHPEVRRLFLARLAEQKDVVERGAAPSPLILYIVPLLFESKLPREGFDAVAVVAAPREVCLQRIIQRDGCTRDAAEKKLNSQIPIDEKIREADFIIRNDGSWEDLERETTKFLKEALEPEN